jgi:hypothetical protein
VEISLNAESTATSLKLRNILDVNSAAAHAESLLKSSNSWPFRGAVGVRRRGPSYPQVVPAAAGSTSMDDFPLSIEGASPAFLEDLLALGFEVDTPLTKGQLQ